MTRLLPPPASLSSERAEWTPSHSGYSREWRRREHDWTQSTTAPPCFTTLMSYSFTRMPQTATRHQNGVHVDIFSADPPCSWLHCTTMFDCLCPPAPRKGHNQYKDTYIVLTQVYKVVWRWWLILHSFRQTDTQTHRHMLERVSLPFESVCWNQRWNQRYDNLATKPRRQCAALWAALRVLWFTAHVDIPPFALKHTQHKYTHPCVNSYTLHTTHTHTHTTHTSRNKNLQKQGTNPLMASGQKASFPSSHCRSRRACGGLLVSL